MSNSRSVTFRHSPFQGWTLTVIGETEYGQVVQTWVMIQAPGSKRGGTLAFRLGVPGFEITSEALTCGSGVASLEAVAQWVINATRVALAERDDIDPAQRAYWQGIVDHAAVTATEFYERYPDGVVPAFEAIGHLIATDGSALARLGAEQAKADAR